MVSSLAQKTIKHVTAKLESGESAGLSEIVELIQKLSSNAYETSIQELSALIGKDVVVTAKVIAAANTIGYNPSGVEVSTISQAIHVIGFNKIRQLTVSLLLVESANRHLNPSEKREIAALALCSGLMAESVMTQRGTVAPDHAFICASLRSYGRLLMTSFMIEEYRKAKVMATTGMSEDAAFNRVFGLTPLELGYHLLASAHLPEPILKSLRAAPPGLIRNIAEKPELELLALADLSVRVCELALRSDVGAKEFEKQTAMLALRSGKNFGLDSEALIGLLQETGQQLHDFAHAFGFKALTEQFSPRLNARVKGTDPVGFGKASLNALPNVRPVGDDTPQAEEAETSPESEYEQAAEAAPAPSLASPPVSAVSPPPAESPATSTPLSTASAPVPPAAIPPLASTPPVVPVPSGTDAALPSPESKAPEGAFHRAFQSGIEQLASLMENDSVDMRKVFDAVLAAALQGFASNEGVLFLRDASGRKFIPSLGSGPLFQAIRATASVREEDRDAFGLCLQRMEDILIYDANDPKLDAHLPSWIKANKLASFVLLPMQDNRRPFALLLIGWPEKKTVGFTVSQIRQVRSMLKLAGTARKLSDSRR